ncbi:MAG: hypothetical protein C5B43_04130 [Verrucomicrobia bacterium]|nr:MAG: hypothetical protein C5B43_04130 [Verrucomicrobiota bacterium]
MRLPEQDSSTGRGLKTFFQALIAFAVGLVLAVLKVPGVTEAIHTYVLSHITDTLLSVGIPIAITTGLTSFVWNFFRSDVKNY